MKIKLFTVLITLVAICIYGVASGSQIRVTHDLPAKVKLYLLQEPKINETVTVVYEIITQCNVDALSITIGVDGGQVIGKHNKATKQGKQYSYVNEDFINVKKGGIYKYTVKIKILSSPFRISGCARGKGYTGENGKIVRLGSPPATSLYYYLDENTGRLRTIEQAQTDIVYHYNPSAGEFLKEPDASGVEINRGIIKRMKSFESALSDSQALALHGDMVQGIMFGIGVSKNDASKPTKEVEDMIIKYLLKEGWLDKLKNRTKDKWFEKLKQESKVKFDKSEGDDKGAKALFIFNGQWKYKKHGYSKDLGLLTSAQDAMIDQCKVRIRAYWLGSGGNRWYTCYTDGNGNFSAFGYDLPTTQFIYSHPILYLWNYDNTVKVTTPTASVSIWRDPIDDYVWFLTPAVNKVDTTYGTVGSCNYGVVYPESLKTGITQPRSGAVNIYSALLNGYKYLVPAYITTPVVTTVTAVWTVNYVAYTNTFYSLSNKTIYVLGSATTNTDEWDDQVLFHEYGHFAQDIYAVSPNYTSTSYTWNDSYPGDQNLSYSEGWPEFFAGAISDSIYHVNTQFAIGDPSAYAFFWNREDPWDYSENGTLPFLPSPYTIGSVTGSLWDLYDSQNENPYSTDAYCDTLTMGFDPIWNVTTKFKPGGHNCYNIWEFIQGWGSMYDHQNGFESILRHHKIFKPARPVNVTAGVSPFNYWTVVVTWEMGGSKYSGNAKNDTITVGYNVYRRVEGEEFYWKINDALITAFTFDDPNLPDNKNYYYKVVGVDTSNVEGFFSDSVIVYVPHPPFKTKINNATAFNNTHKLIYSPALGKTHLIYGSDKGLYYAYSTDFGMDWSTDTILSYEADNRSCLALDTLGYPSVIWKKWSSTFEYTRQASPWIPPYDTVWMPAIVYSRPTMAISRHDTAYVAYTYYSVVSNEETREGDISVATFPITDFMSAINENLGFMGKTPMVAVDDSNNIYIAYVSDNDIYFTNRISGVWGTPVNISQTSAISQHPMIDAYGDKLSVTWEEDNGGSFDIYNRILTISANTWTNSENVSNNISNSLNPVTAMAGYVYWADNENGYYRIYSKRYIDGAGWPDSTKRTITNNDSICNYPQITYSQTVDTTKILAIWTQGSYSPYDVSFQRNITPPAAKIFVDGGTELASPFNISRDGFKVFGPASYQSIDYGAEEVAYKFDNLSSNNDYKVSVTYYFENEASDAKSQSNKPIWHEQLKIDKQTVATSKVKVGQPTTVEVLVPPQWYAKDGSIVLTVNNINGDYAMATDVKLYEFTKPTSAVKSTDGGTQTAFTTPVTLPLTNQLCQNAPNPFGSQPTTIQYAVTKPGNVSLKVYNISGQVVKTLVNESKQPGYYNARWNGKDETGKQAATGVYFYRIQANGFEYTRKLLIIK